MKAKTRLHIIRIYHECEGGIEYKNLSWVWGLDRKIRLKDRHLASRGLPSDDKLWSRGTDFSILPSHE